MLYQLPGMKEQRGGITGKQENKNQQEDDMSGETGKATASGV